MAAITSLTILLPNARRRVVKVQPNTTILQILEDVCISQNLKSEEFDLVHQNKPLDVSLTLRFSNLPNNCVLELQPTRSKSKGDEQVTIALQPESGQRFVDKFTSNTSLWEVVEHFKEKGNMEDLTDAVSEVEPVCIFMRNEVVGEENLKTMTLRKLGITSGKAVIRLIFRLPASLKEQASSGSYTLTSKITKESTESDTDWKIWKTPQNSNYIEYSEAPSSETNDAPSTSGEISDSTTKVTKMDITFEAVDISETATLLEEQLNNNQNMNVELELNTEPQESIEHNTEETVTEENIIVLGPRNAILFDMKTASRTTIELPEQFFEPTLDDVRYLYNDLRRQRERLNEKPLLLECQRNSMSSMLCYQHCILRIRFPNYLVLQANFDSTETVSTVMEFLRTFLEDPNCDFYLYTTPPRCILSSDLKLIEANLVPAAVVHFGSDASTSNYLSAEVLSKISTLAGATQSASKFRNSSGNVIQHQDECLPATSETNQIAAPSHHLDQASLDNVNRERPHTKNVPKWFKIGK